MKKHILDNDLEDWKQYLKENNFKSFRANQIFHWLHNQLSIDLSDASNLPKKLVLKIQEDFRTKETSNINKRISNDSEKILWDVNNRKIESVLLKYNNRFSVCVSVQSGCTLNCSFCATGKLAFTGNLSVGEILEQVYFFQRESNTRISNIVFMGMGEPFYNYDNTIKAANILSDKEGLDISKHKITISTVGVMPELERFVKEEIPYNLALSVHAVSSEKRLKLMQIEKKYSLKTVTEFLAKNRNLMQKNQLTFEYIMIKNMNMTKDDAYQLGRLAKKLRAKINLIPINTDYEDYICPSKNEIDDFWEILNNLKVVAINRGSAGFDIDGACGMLAAN